MAKQTINIGAAPNDGTGTPLRTSFDYCNQNFTELYTATGPSGNNIVVPGSATITGDLTVDTSTLKVDSANDRVGIGTATPAAGYKLDVAGTVSISGGTSNARRLQFNASGAYANWIEADGVAGANYLRFAAGNAEVMRIDLAGVCNWFNGAGGTRMTLDSTGLGVGMSPSAILSALKSSATQATGLILRNANGTDGSSISLDFETSAGTSGVESTLAGRISGRRVGAGTTGALDFFVNNYGTLGTAKMTIDSSGNVGVGVTPSAWNNSYNVLEIGANGSISGRTSANNQVDIVSNGFRDAGGTWVYKLATSNAAARYLVDGSVGGHFWYSGVAGTAPNTIAGFSTASMTLDASGNLLVGTTSALSAWATRLTLSTDAGTTKWAVGPYAATTNFIISASGSFGVYLNGTSAVSWTGISDERLKDIIEPISNAVAKVGKLRSVIGKFKADETNTRRSFLLAQDVQAVLPEAVDASNPDRLGVAYTDVIPLLVAAIKELAAEVNALKKA
jgi:hypothetical protein